VRHELPQSRQSRDFPGRSRNIARHAGHEAAGRSRHPSTARQEMTILSLILWILVLGVIVYLVYRFAPIPAGFKTAVYVICMAIAVLITLRAFGIMPDLDATVPRVK
jgi:hypothetical protein